MISAFVGKEPYTMKNLSRIILSELKVYGFIVTSLMPKHEAAFYKDVPKWLAEGQIKYLEDTKNGLEHTGQALADMLVGKNIGKSIINVGQDI